MTPPGMKRPSRILVVDDEPRNVRLLEALLTPHGFEVVGAESGYECLEKLDELTPDLVLLDVMMPGMDGFETTRRIRSRESTCLVPVVLVTSLRDTTDRVTGIESGCDDFISKPFHSQELLARIHTTLSLRRDWQRRRDYDRRDSNRIVGELNLARQTQQALLLKTLPRIAGIDLWARHISSTELSGDYFDIIDLGPTGPVILAMADVSGKGAPAALLMANVQAGLRGQLLGGVQKLSGLMRNLNRLVCQNTRGEMFVTMFIAEYWKREGHLRYVRAGHELPCVASGGVVRTLATGGPPLGIIEDAQFEVAETHLRPGDVCCLYTDGIPDARDPAGESFGQTFLLGVLSNAGDASVEQIGESILASVANFSAGAQQFDDMTLLLFRVQSR